MEVEVKLFAALRQGRFAKDRMDLPEGASLGDVLDRLAIPRGDAGILLVNGRSAEAGDGLSLNDVVSVFPAIGGG